jgi:hypothetical protein
LLREHFDLSERSAQGYMKLAKNMATLPAADTQRVALLPLREALANLAKPRQPTPRKVCAGAKPRPDQTPQGVREHRLEEEGAQRRNPETVRAFEERDQLAALVAAWEGASLHARQNFLIQTAADIKAITKTWKAKP